MVAREEVCIESALSLIIHKIWSWGYVVLLYPLIWWWYTRSLLIFHRWSHLFTVAKVIGLVQIWCSFLWRMLFCVMVHLVDVEWLLAWRPVGAYLCLFITLHLWLWLAIYFFFSVFYFLTLKHFDIFWDYIIGGSWLRTALIILESHLATITFLLHSILKLLLFICLLRTLL